MKERKPFLLRMDPALHVALEQWAQQELRSLNGQIEFILKEAIARRSKSEKRDEAEALASPQSPPAVTPTQ